MRTYNFIFLFISLLRDDELLLLGNYVKLIQQYSFVFIKYYIFSCLLAEHSCYKAEDRYEKSYTFPVMILTEVGTGRYPDHWWTSQQEISGAVCA